MLSGASKPVSVATIRIGFEPGEAAWSLGEAAFSLSIFESQLALSTQVAAARARKVRFALIGPPPGTTCDPNAAYLTLGDDVLPVHLRRGVRMVPWSLN